MEKENQENVEKQNKFMKWFKRVGWAGLIFFTVKGLIWLVIFYFGADAIRGCGK